MNKYLIATHGELAKGIRSTVELFVGSERPITYISAYTAEEPDLEEQLHTFFSEVKDNETVVVFTDLYGGSVNQKVAVMASTKKNVFVIAGFNLPVILETVLKEDTIDQKFLDKVIENARKNLQQVKLGAKADGQDFFD